MDILVAFRVKGFHGENRNARRYTILGLLLLPGRGRDLGPPPILGRRRRPTERHRRAIGRAPHARPARCEQVAGILGPRLQQGVLMVDIAPVGFQHAEPARDDDVVGGDDGVLGDVLGGADGGVRVRDVGVLGDGGLPFGRGREGAAGIAAVVEAVAGFVQEDVDAVVGDAEEGDDAVAGVGVGVGAGGEVDEMADVRAGEHGDFAEEVHEGGDGHGGVFVRADDPGLLAVVVVDAVDGEIGGVQATGTCLVGTGLGERAWVPLIERVCRGVEVV